MTSITSIDSLNLDLPPSCIAVCPTQPQYFVVGTYCLHPKEALQGVDVGSGGTLSGENDSVVSEELPQRRSGSLILYQLDNDSIVHAATAPAPDFAILDIQWTPQTAALGDLLAVATSTGLLAFYQLSDEGGSRYLEPTCRKQICETSILVLSLAWHPRRPEIIGVTLSDGSVCLCESTGGVIWGLDSAVRVTHVQQHTLEAWTLAFLADQDDHIDVLSGGDDMVLQRCTINDNDECTELWRDRRIHQAGVTAILPLDNELILTGSYDDHIRLIAAPPTGRRQLLAETTLGGGVWRLKLLNVEGTEASASEKTSTLSASTRYVLHTRFIVLRILRGVLDAPQSYSYRPSLTVIRVLRSLVILASCMHAGTRVLRLSRSDNREWSFEVLGKFEEHKSMNYGSDVLPGHGRLKTIVSTSFYDKLLCLWRFDIGSQE
ncbi:hypothetical protein LTR85_001016 [Meristemomyces frigidus]|nr:hypothetical protein LTR85_001016 [Meristemomyces frigidus]